MATCKKLRRTLTKVCTGSLNKKIQIQTRRIKPPMGDSVDYVEEFVEIITVWAMLETITGVAVFDGTNVMETTAHDFYIRYIPNITFEKWILYAEKYYDIINVENFQENNLYYRIRTNLRGREELLTNEA